MQRGELFVLSAPSGTGKTTLIHAMFEDHLAAAGGLVFSVSHTTRPPRPNEVDGVDYHFVGTEEFRRMIDQDRFLEWAEVHRVAGNYYGTSRDAVFSHLEAGTDVLLDVDVQGAEQVMARCPEARSIFVLPPSFADLERRLRGRNSEADRQISVRLGVSHWEISRYTRYEYVIINDDVERASRALASIILDKRHILARQRDRVEEVLEDFRTQAPNAAGGGGQAHPRAEVNEEATHDGEDAGEDR